jgi:hypothetical protein
MDCLQTELPYWMKVLQALSTPAIAVLGLTIAWAQWTTSRSKLVLDLFEQRAKIYSDLLEPIYKSLREARTDTDTFLSFASAAHQSQFLFGQDVLDRVMEIQGDLNQYGYVTTMLQGDRLQGEELTTHLNMKHVLQGKLSGFPDELTKLMAPYMLMDQRRPWSIGRLLEKLRSNGSQSRSDR